MKGYNLFLSIVVPITLGCALFAEDIVQVFLGAKWRDAAGIFRLMSPTILVFALINPFAWLMLSSGLAVRSLKIALVIAPVVILSYVVGLKWGPDGVAAGFSIAMAALAIPVIAWAKHGTLITTGDAFKAVARPLGSIAFGAAAWWGLSGLVNKVGPVFPRLVLESAILFGVYGLVMLFVMKQKSVYVAVLRETGLWPGARRASNPGGK